MLTLMKILLCELSVGWTEQLKKDGTAKAATARTSSRFLLILLFMPLFSCSEHRADCLNTDSYRNLQKIAERMPSASKDADIALSKGDHRLLGVYGFTTDIPGVTGVLDYESESKIINNYGVRMIEGTSDTPCDLNVANRVHEYATIYNKRLMERLNIRDQKER